MSSFEEVTIGDCRLILGDCRDVLPTLPKHDLLLTDPPYGLGKRMQGGTWGSAQKYKDLVVWDERPDDGLMMYLVSASKNSVIWGGNYFSFPPSRCWLVWDKQNAVPTMADCEMAWTNFDANTKRISLPVGSHASGHPSEKPVRLMEWSLRAANAVGNVLDPFMGSGTTGVACARAGLQFTGVDRERKYFDIACERIDNSYRQEPMVFDTPRKQVQDALI